MGYSQEEAFRKWYLDGKNCKASGVCSDGDEFYSDACGLMSIKIKGTPFVLLNHDVLDTSFDFNPYCAAVKVLGNSYAGFSFIAFRKTGESLNDVEIVNTGDSTKSMYRFGATIKANGRVFMSIKDDMWRGMLELDYKPKTYQEAIDGIEPRLSREARPSGVAPTRQGEWWFVPNRDVSFRGLKKEKYVALDNHRATTLFNVDGRRYAKGTIRHHPECKVRHSWYNRYYRKMLKLGDVWHECLRGNFVNSYRAR